MFIIFFLDYFIVVCGMNGLLVFNQFFEIVYINFRKLILELRFKLIIFFGSYENDLVNENSIVLNIRTLSCSLFLNKIVL